MKPEWHPYFKWWGLAGVVLGTLGIASGFFPGPPSLFPLFVGGVAIVIGVFLETRWHRETGYRQYNTNPWIKLWVWTHLAFITIKCLPTAPGEVKGAFPTRQPFGTEYLLLATDKIKPALDLYLWPTGFWQSWDMFAPNPSWWEGYVTAKVFYRDGTVKNVTYPRMKELPLGLKYFKERYRKFLERAHTEDFKWMWGRFALRIAYENYHDPANPPDKVELWRNWFKVPGTVTFPEYMKELTGAIREGRLNGKVLLPPNPEMPDYNHINYYTYVVEPDALRRLAQE
jgi:hypothetical protein